MPITLRLGLYYATIFIGNGAAAPYASVWFKSHGLSGAAIGLILAAPAFGRAVTGPGVAFWADRFKLRRTPLMILGLAMAVSFLALPLVHGFWPWLIVWFVTQTLYSSLSPLADVIALRRARRDGFNYGWPRGIGSAAYVVGNVGMGLVITATTPDSLLVWVTAAALATGVGARALLPPDQVHEEAAAPRPTGENPLKALGELLRNPVFLLAIVSTGLIQASHGFYYGFSSLAWRAQGLSVSLPGLLWGVGVAAEVVFLWFMEPWRRRVGAERLVVLGALGAIARWTCLGFSPPLWLLIPIQAMHALTYTATFIGSLQLMERLAPPRHASIAQTLNSVLSGGFLIGGTTMASGWLFDRMGANGYFAMSAIAFLGLVGALCLPALQRAVTGRRVSGAA